MTGWFSRALLLVTLATSMMAAGCLGPRMQLRRQIATGCSVTNRAFTDSLSAIVGTPFVGGNRITPLINGDEIFPAMLRAIDRATNSVNLENYLWRSGPLSDEFVSAMCERARAGVEVRVITDAFGSVGLDKKDVEKMRTAGVNFNYYNPLQFHALPRLNFRDHRKLLIVDGAIGFAGGVCVADEWTGDAETAEQWRETHFQVEGPAAAQLQGVFAANWLKTEGELLFGPKLFPSLAPQGESVAQAFRSGPQDGREMARMVYLSAIAAAKTNIRIAQSYFVPDELAKQALIDAQKRGVKVEIITPSQVDAGAVRRASRWLWPELLHVGVGIYEYGPAMYHCKFMIVDDFFVTAGSVNFDERSFRINDESNINVLDRDLATVLIAQFERDKAQSRRMTARRYKRTPWYGKLYERVAVLFRSQF
jgi:cardiolipin synthase A/B